MIRVTKIIAVTRLAKTPDEKLHTVFLSKKSFSRSHHSMKHSPGSWTFRGLGDEGSGKKIGPPFLELCCFPFNTCQISEIQDKSPPQHWFAVQQSWSPNVLPARYDRKGILSKQAFMSLASTFAFCIVSATCLRQSLLRCLFIPSEAGLRNTEALF